MVKIDYIFLPKYSFHSVAVAGHLLQTLPFLTAVSHYFVCGGSSVECTPGISWKYLGTSQKRSHGVVFSHKQSLLAGLVGIKVKIKD